MPEDMFVSRIHIRKSFGAKSVDMLPVGKPFEQGESGQCYLLRLATGYSTSCVDMIISNFDLNPHSYV